MKIDIDFFVKTKSVCLPVWKTFQFTVANIHEILEPSLETKAHKKAKKKQLLKSFKCKLLIHSKDI